MKRLNGAGTRALETIKQFTVAQRTIAIIGVAVLVLGGVALVNYLGQPSYQVLYSNISASEASAVTAQLDKDKVQYQLQDGGQTILVPNAAVNAERLATATLLSSGAGGYSLLDNMGVTASEFQQNVTYKRAIEGELANTIEAINGVSSASVQLAIPQQSVFTDQKEDPTASVFVNVSSPLTTDQVNAIVHLVAAAYPGLTTDNVSVVDQRGDTLSSVGSGTAGSGSDAAADYEQATKNAVQAMLDKVLGPGNAVVTVAADVSSSSGRKTSETYSGANGPAFSESSSKTTGGAGSGTAGSGNGVSGVLGTDTTDTSTGGNSATAGGSGSGSGGASSTSVVKNNAVNKTTTDETIVPGTLNRQTIAVALNASTVTGVSTGSITQMVTNAAGVNLSRGDTVSVTSVPFSTAAAKTAASALAQSQKAAGANQMTDIITTAIKVVGGLVLFILVTGLLRKLFRKPEPTTADAGVLNIVPGGDPALGGYAPTQQLGGFAAPGQLQTGGPGTAPTVALNAPADGAFAQLQADVDALAGSDPNQTAEYLRALMGDRAGV
ncbi:flagellar basal-body MS-ring/collar protein FliF [Amnibacterium kyonggiense]|uniref:Flagellar M-ring protein n=1 Tax=Amnibacterium kyonggiense TaxID=595671 RepID=A0A4R7FQL1_9MICO|nr:flagellar basal-body MS-ring/collar protein FliF [Amnibacterium kyonggiense]TDS80071.1 flagellar M-ring protein FliF [Amnibacterium kyonggiense]